MLTTEQAANDYTSVIHDPNMGKGLKIKNAFIAGAEFMEDKYKEELRWREVSELPMDNLTIECRIKKEIYIGKFKSYGINVLMYAFSKEKCEYISFSIFDSWRPLIL